MADDGTNTLYFTYDASGTPLALIYNNSLYYYYVTNVQGDVIALVDSTGATVVEYTYDAWGNILTTTGLFANTIGAQNPLRYRGYVYDTETGLYYLQSRYYNPEMGRFICADVYAATGQGFIGNNMFVYCGNNPVIYKDDSGTRYCAATTVAGESVKERKEACIHQREIVKAQSSVNSFVNTAKAVVSAVVNNVELSAGVGQGLYYEQTIFDVIGLQVGMYGNYATLKLEDGKFEFGQELNQGVAVSLLWYNFGFSEYMFNQNGITVDSEDYSWLYGNETLTLYSVAVYPTAGYSFSVEFDIIQFCRDMDDIF